MGRRPTYAALAALAALGAWGYNDLVLDRHPVDFELTEIYPNPAAPGSYTSLFYMGQQNYICDGIIHRWIVDSAGTVHDLPDVTMFQYDGASSAPVQFEREIRIPASAAHGVATMHVTAVRWCNVLQHMFWPIQDTHKLNFLIEKD